MAGRVFKGGKVDEIAVVVGQIIRHYGLKMYMMLEFLKKKSPGLCTLFPLLRFLAF
ncbi:hypothetical protein L484_004354 [Morus notabilis]|uniref:Uncharacterized protein n=1 Tax=Morus notabilis TaxID=981085 RepID=W9QBF2_9ROSA|nr:hypothetical protein L484_004354 [Morus notabilis]